MVQYLILMLVVVLLVYVIKLVKLVDKFNRGLENFNANILDNFNDVKTDIANSTAKIQDRICGIHESIENHQKDMVELTKKAFEEQIRDIKLINNFNFNGIKGIISTAMKDAAAHRQDIYNTAKDAYGRISTHDNYVIAHNKEVRQVLAELLSAIQSLSVAKTDNVSADTTTAIEKPKKAIRRNKRKYTKDTEEVKE